MAIQKIDKNDIDFSHIYRTKQDAENQQNTVNVNEVYWGDNGDLLVDDETGLVTENGVALGFINKNDLTHKSSDGAPQTTTQDTTSPTPYTPDYVSDKTEVDNSVSAPALAQGGQSSASISPIQSETPTPYTPDYVSEPQEDVSPTPYTPDYVNDNSGVPEEMTFEDNTYDNDVTPASSDSEIASIDQPKEVVDNTPVENNNVNDDIVDNQDEYSQDGDTNDVEEDIEILNYEDYQEEAPEEDQEVISMIQDLHDQHLSVSDYEHNCGYLVSDQLALLGLTDRDKTKYGSGKYYAKALASNDSTIDGHTAVGYESNSSTQRQVFEDIIAENNGSLSNLVISFNKGGSFSSDHGHVMLINKIEDGRVYFIDDWKKYRNNSIKGYDATSLTIDEFEEQYLKSSNNSNYMTHIK